MFFRNPFLSMLAAFALSSSPGAVALDVQRPTHPGTTRGLMRMRRLGGPCTFTRKPLSPSKVRNRIMRALYRYPQGLRFGELSQAAEVPEAVLQRALSTLSHRIARKDNRWVIRQA